jgi:glycopeptide antibiotics resistance protein
MSSRAAAFILLAWAAIGLALTLLPGDPLPGQVVTDNFVPFRTIGIYFDNLDSAFWVSQAIGNLLLLLPLGLFGPLVLPWLSRWWRVALVAVLVSACIETVQLLIPDRSADVDDVLINTLGALLGYGVLRLVRSGPRAGAALASRE